MLDDRHGFHVTRYVVQSAMSRFRDIFRNFLLPRAMHSSKMELHLPPPSHLSPHLAQPLNVKGVDRAATVFWGDVKQTCTEPAP